VRTIKKFLDSRHQLDKQLWEDISALKLRGVEKQHQAVGLRFISAIVAVEYYVHQLVSIEERASKLGIGIVQGRSHWKARLEDAYALDQLIDPLLNLEEQLFHHIESIDAEAFSKNECKEIAEVATADEHKTRWCTSLRAMKKVETTTPAKLSKRVFICLQSLSSRKYMQDLKLVHSIMRCLPDCMSKMKLLRIVADVEASIDVPPTSPAFHETKTPELDLTQVEKVEITNELQNIPEFYAFYGALSPNKMQRVQWRETIQNASAPTHSFGLFAQGFFHLAKTLLLQLEQHHETQGADHRGDYFPSVGQLKNPLSIEASFFGEYAIAKISNTDWWPAQILHAKDTMMNFRLKKQGYTLVRFIGESQSYKIKNESGNIQPFEEFAKAGRHQYGRIPKGFEQAMKDIYKHQ